MFLNVCKKAGWEAYGMEPDDEARKIASAANLNLFSDKSRINTYITDKKFNVITLWHVLEHVTDMDETLSFFKNRLDKNGVLIIAVPNHVSYDAKHYGEYWAAYDVPRHLHHFEKKTIQQLVESKGFRLRETLPMKFDSYYVSLLSEKYKTQKTNLLKAFLVGLRSNVSANNERYSSSIYIFSHA
jgi:2-polyprenyl-3-methyl-5-hydroxy-6-metoxy-1,4-benzoquinol methylase